MDVRTVSVDVVLPLRHAVLRAGMPIEAACIEGDTDPGAVHLAAFDGDAVVGVATLLPRPMPGDGSSQPAMQLRGMAVAESHRGAGVGAAVLQNVLDQARRHNALVVWCNARLLAAGFYRRLGFEQHGDTFDVPTAGPHVRMSIAL